MQDLVDRLRAFALSSGAVAVGITSAAPFAEAEAAIRDRGRLGYHAGMHFTMARPDVSCRPESTLPGARPLVVAAAAYATREASAPKGVAAGRIARFAIGDRYAPLRRVLGGVAAILRDAGWQAAVLCDDNRLVDRAAAARAGVGWIGRNANVLVPGHGSWVLLGSVATDAALPADAPMRRTCGTCNACLPACPTGALVAPGVLDSRLCLAYWLQAPGDIPAELRVAVGDRLYGCDDCQEACPPSIAGTRRGAEHVDPWVHAVAILTSPDAELLARFGHFYIPRRQPDHLRRNALVVIGNSGRRETITTVAAFLHHPRAMLRRHAAWALGRLGGAVAAAYLAARLQVEDDADTVVELQAARASLLAGAGEPAR